ncbi:hypothetical protein [Nostoc sp.]
MKRGKLGSKERSLRLIDLGKAAYTYLPKKPSIDIYPKDLPALPPAIF